MANIIQSWYFFFFFICGGMDHGELRSDCDQGALCEIPKLSIKLGGGGRMEDILSWLGEEVESYGVYLTGGIGSLHACSSTLEAALLLMFCCSGLSVYCALACPSIIFKCFMKTLARYVLLSWTLHPLEPCTMSPSVAHKLPSLLCSMITA